VGNAFVPVVAPRFSSSCRVSESGGLKTNTPEVISQQSHRNAASLEQLAQTIRFFQDAPEGMQQLPLNLEATEEVTMEALRRFGVAEQRIDLFGEYAGQNRDPPPVLELVMKMTGLRTKEKTNNLMVIRHSVPRGVEPHRSGLGAGRKNSPLPS
jgi:hypothetical protein